MNIEDILTAWRLLEASGAKCTLDLAANAAGKLEPIFHCLTEEGMGSSLWLNGNGTLTVLANWTMI